jgi:hypothetical protein
MTDDSKLPAIRPNSTPASVSLSPTVALDLSWLPEDKRAALLEEHARGMLAISRKAQEMHVDVAALTVALGAVSNATLQATKDGNSATASHTHTTSNSRTEIIMGNTDAARVGKLTKSQTGETNWTPIYIIIGIIAVVIVVTSLAK